MRNLLGEYIGKFTKKHSDRRKAIAVLVLLALIVTTAVFWALKLKGISMTYDPQLGGNITSPIETVDNRDYYGSQITINMFDYDAVDGDKSQGLNDRINNGHLLKFIGNGQTNGTLGINDYTGQIAGTNQAAITGNVALQGIVKNTLVNGYPELASNKESLSYLFPSNGTNGVSNNNVTPYYDTTGLFKENAGWLIYDSNANYAYLSKSNRQFGVNSSTFTQTGSNNAIGFFPFNDLNTNQTNVNNANNGNPYYNHHFGMTMEAEFTMFPNGRVNNEDMQFIFSGDDDMWVYIDDVLVLDIGGIHDPVTGAINLASGKVTVSNTYQVGQTRGNGNYKPQNTDLNTLFQAATGSDFDSTPGETHTIKVFYLERGGVNSNLNISTNIFAKQKVIVEKQWKDGNVTVDHSGQTVTYTLNKVNNATGIKTPVNLGAGHGELTAANGWRDEVEVDELDGTFHYEVEETSKFEGYKSSVIASSTHGGNQSDDDMQTGNWAQTNSMTNGKIYGLVGAGNNKLTRYYNEWHYVANDGDTVTGESVDNILMNSRWAYEDGRLRNLAVTALDKRTDSNGVVLGEENSYLLVTTNKRGNQIMYYTTKENASQFSLVETNTPGVYALQITNGNGTQYLSQDSYGNVYTTPFGFRIYEYNEKGQHGGLTATVDNDKFTIVNEKLPAGSITVSKVWADKLGKTGWVDDVEIELHQVKYNKADNSKVSDNVIIYHSNQRIELNSANTSFTYENLVTEDDGYTYKYYVKEYGENSSKYYVEGISSAFDVIYDGASADSPINTGSVIITNRNQSIVPIYTEIVVNKDWREYDGSTISAPADVNIILHQIDTYYTIDNEGNQVGTENSTLNSNFKTGTVLQSVSAIKFENLPSTYYDENTSTMHKYTYYATEENESDGRVTINEEEYDVAYSVSYSAPTNGGDVSVTNTRVWETESKNLVITKIWIDENGDRCDAPDDVRVTVYRKGLSGSGKTLAQEEYTTVILSKYALSRTLANVPLETKIGDEIYHYTYYIKEVNENAGHITIGNTSYKVTYSDDSNVAIAEDKFENVTVTNSLSALYVPPTAEVTHTKTIDYLNDLEDNDDTNVDDDKATMDDDLYRLYLTLGTLSQSGAVDLLIVVDQSGSMYEINDIKYQGTTHNNINTNEGKGLAYRDTVLSAIINGYAVTVNANGTDNKPNFANRNNIHAGNYKYTNATLTDDSLVNRFLSLNPDNQVAVIGFDGQRRQEGAGNTWGEFPYRANEGYKYDVDTTEILDWRSSLITNPLDVEGHCFTGTNYEAALLKAGDMFDRLSDNDHKKVLVFFSDGVPTCFIRTQDDVDAGLNSPYGYNALGDRDGTTRSGNAAVQVENIGYCMDPTKRAIDEFVKKHPEVNLYSFGLSAELTGSINYNGQQRANDEVLNYMAIAGNGDCYNVGDDGNKLKEVFEELLIPPTPIKAVIKDELSQYVEYYVADPDLKVVMTNAFGEVKILYDGNNPSAAIRFINSTGANKPIIKSCSYDSATRTVTAVFDEDYIAPPNAEYALSFNVQVSQAAYEEFNSNGYSGVKGDSSTDFSDNSTSSNKGGFYSNEKAEVTYDIKEIKDGGNPEFVEGYEEYPHPVVQLETAKIVVDKSWVDENGNPVAAPQGEIPVQIWQVKIPVAEESSGGGQSGSGGGSGSGSGSNVPIPGGIETWVPVNTLTPDNTYLIVGPNGQLYGSNNILNGTGSYGLFDTDNDNDANRANDKYRWYYNSNQRMLCVLDDKIIGVSGTNDAIFTQPPGQGGAPVTYDGSKLKVGDYYHTGNNAWNSQSLNTNYNNGGNFTIYELRYIAPEPGSTQWQNVTGFAGAQNDDVFVIKSDGHYLYLDTSNYNNTIYKEVRFTADGNNNAKADNAFTNDDDAVRWIYEDGKLYAMQNGTKYYLTIVSRGNNVYVQCAEPNSGGGTVAINNNHIEVTANGATRALGFNPWWLDGNTSVAGNISIAKEIIIPPATDPEEPDDSDDPSDEDPVDGNSVLFLDNVIISKPYWTTTVSDLPLTGIEKVDGKPVRYRYKYYIKEIIPANVNYEASYKDKDGNEINELSAVNDEINNIIITNTVPKELTMELPNTGGSGKLIYLLSGLMLIASVSLLGYKYSKGRRNETS